MKHRTYLWIVGLALAGLALFNVFLVTRATSARNRLVVLKELQRSRLAAQDASDSARTAFAAFLKNEMIDDLSDTVTNTQSEAFFHYALSWKRDQTGLYFFIPDQGHHLRIRVDGWEFRSKFFHKDQPPGELFSEEFQIDVPPTLNRLDVQLPYRSNTADVSALRISLGPRQLYLREFVDYTASGRLARHIDNSHVQSARPGVSTQSITSDDEQSSWITLFDQTYRLRPHQVSDPSIAVRVRIDLCCLNQSPLFSPDIIWRQKDPSVWGWVDKKLAYRRTD